MIYDLERAISLYQFLFGLHFYFLNEDESVSEAEHLQLVEILSHTTEQLFLLMGEQ